MCTNCGRGEYSKRHKPTDITIEDLRAAAQGHHMEVETAADSVHAGARELKQAGKIS